MGQIPSRTDFPNNYRDDESSPSNDTLWSEYIEYVFESNNNLFAEFDMQDGLTWVFFWTWKGKRLKAISQSHLLFLIEKFINSNKKFSEKKYYTSTRTKSGTNHYYLGISIIKENIKNSL